MAAYSEIFNRNFKVLTLLGLWALDTKDERKKLFYYLYQWVALLFYATTTLIVLIDLYLVRNDIEKFNSNVPCTIPIVLVFLRALIYLKKFPIIKNLREELNLDADEESDEEYKKILGKAATEINFLTVALYPGATFVTMGYSIAPLLDYNSEVRNLPIRAWFPFDTQISPNYEFAYFYVTCVCLFIGFCLVANDLATFGFMIAIAAEFEILKRKMEKLAELCENQKGDVLRDGKTSGMIKDIVVHHQKIISQIKKFEDISNKMFGMQFLSISLLVASVAVDVAVISRGLSAGFITEVSYLTACLIFAFHSCLYGTRLQTMSYELAHAAYDVPWYLMKSKFRRDLGFVIAQAQRPTRVTVGKLAVVNFSFYLDVLNATYSMITFFIKVTSKNEK